MKDYPPIRRNVKDSFRSQVELYLMGQVESNAWKVGEKIPSERDLAEILDVSRITVREAVLALTSKGIFERSVGKGTYVRKRPDARTETKLKTGNIGFIVCREKSIRKTNIIESWYYEIFSCIEDEASRQGLDAMFSTFDDKDAGIFPSLSGFLKKIDGVIILEAWNREFLEFIRNSGVPVVLLAPGAPFEAFDFLSLDLAEGTRTAVNYLVGLGHTKIAIVNAPQRYESARIRFAAWKETLHDAGLPVEDGLIEGSDDQWNAEAGYHSMCRLLDRKIPFTAVFCVNDLLAVGALSALYERALHVPGDISVIGFDDSEVSRHTAPPLTTMRLPARQMGRMAVLRLVEKVQNPDDLPVRIELPVQLIQRKSCRQL